MRSPEQIRQDIRQEIGEVTIGSPDAMEARILTWGAALRDLRVETPTGRRGVVLGFEQLDAYRDEAGHLGVVVGRYANRIAGARFRLGGREFRLAANEGRHCLHGGPVGFGRRFWSVLSHDAAGVHLALLSEDGDMGFPGRCLALASYEIRPPATLRLTLQAVCDQPTPLNLTTHSYYNLDGSPDVREHRLTVAADHVTPVDAELIPTGEIAAVAGTALDFRGPRALGSGAPEPGFDINFVLRNGPRAEGELARAAILSSARSRLAMELWTSEPGLQLYDGHKLDSATPGHDGRVYRPFAGVALEPQRFPDGPNRTFFPPSVFGPGQVSRQVTELRFHALA